MTSILLPGSGWESIDKIPARQEINLPDAVDFSASKDCLAYWERSIAALVEGRCALLLIKSFILVPLFYWSVLDDS